MQKLFKPSRLPAGSLIVAATIALASCAGAQPDQNAGQAPTVQINNWADYQNFVNQFGPHGMPSDPVAPPAEFDSKAGTYTATVYEDSNGNTIYDRTIDTKHIATAVFTIDSWKAISTHSETRTSSDGSVSKISGAYNPSAAQNSVDLYLLDQWLKTLQPKAIVLLAAGGTLTAKHPQPTMLAKQSDTWGPASLTDKQVVAALKRNGINYELRGIRSTPAELALFLKIWRPRSQKIVLDNSSGYATLNAIDESGAAIAALDVSWLDPELVANSLSQ